MKREALIFERPETLSATQPTNKDNIRLMVSSSHGHQHTNFSHLADYLNAGDVLVVNNSATLPASLPVSSELGEFRLNLSTNYGSGLWLAEPRWSMAQSGPLPIHNADRFIVGDIRGQFIAPFPNLQRLWFVQFESALDSEITNLGEAIRYAYVENRYPLDHYQTVFAQVAGSAEMPSAAYPFTNTVVDSLHDKGVQIADITLHTGVSSLEVEVDTVEEHPLYPEPFEIPQQTAQIVNQAKKEGRRVIAVGTTVVRSLESAWDGAQIKATSGFTRLYIHPKVGLNVVDGLITGLHDPVTSHLAMLYTIANESLIKEAYQEAIQEGYLWHEFGDSHLILRS
ncbi:MAG: S-adenosylmethionine:tRNA ribosyltransferase-isomerase [Phototrophicaceae bacterium]